MDYRLTELYARMRTPNVNINKNTDNQLITEALGLATYSYQVPSDPEEKLFDFYYLTLVGPAKALESAIMRRAWGGEGYQGEEESYFRGAYFSEEQTQELIMATDDAQNKISNDLQTDLLDATYFSIAAEFRHILDYNDTARVMKFASSAGHGKEFAEWYKTFMSIKGINDAKSMIKKFAPEDDPLKRLATDADVYIPGDTERQQQKQINTFFSNNSIRIASYSAAKQAFKNDDDFIDLAEKIFFGTFDGYTGYSLDWASSYGGPAWGKIAQGWKKLNAAESFLDKMVWVDHILDLEHNTGAMLNKVKRWAKSGGWNKWAWIKQALDFKRDSKHPLKDFMDKISPSLKYLDKKLRYAITGMAEDNPNWNNLDKMINNVYVETNSGATADAGVGGGVVGDKITTDSGLVGTIYKVGSTGKTYVDMDLDAAKQTLSITPQQAGTLSAYYLKYDKSGKFDGLMSKADGAKLPAENFTDTQKKFYGSLSNIEKSAAVEKGNTFDTDGNANNKIEITKISNDKIYIKVIDSEVGFWINWAGIYSKDGKLLKVKPEYGSVWQAPESETLSDWGGLILSQSISTPEIKPGDILKNSGSMDLQLQVYKVTTGFIEVEILGSSNWDGWFGKFNKNGKLLGVNMGGDHWEPPAEHTFEQIGELVIPTESPSTPSEPTSNSAAQTRPDGETIVTSKGLEGKIVGTGADYVEVEITKWIPGVPKVIGKIRFDKSGHVIEYTTKTKPGYWKKTVNPPMYGTIKPPSFDSPTVPSMTEYYNNLKPGDPIETTTGLKGTLNAYQTNPITIAVKITKWPHMLNTLVSHAKFNKHGKAIGYRMKGANYYKTTNNPTKYGIVISKAVKPTAKKKVAPMVAKSGTPAVVNPTAADNTVLKNQGLYTDLLGKYHSKTIAHTGPAGQAGVKSLIIKLDQYDNTIGRDNFSGHLKVKTSHQGGNVLYYDKKIPPVNVVNKVSIDQSGKKAKAWGDKALALGMGFAVLKKKFIIKDGVLYNAVIGPGVIIDGPVDLVNCKLDNCSITENGIELAEFFDCNLLNVTLIDNNAFANAGPFALLLNVIAIDPMSGAPVYPLKDGAANGLAKQYKK